jgi:hypothetical protein
LENRQEENFDVLSKNCTFLVYKSGFTRLTLYS